MSIADTITSITTHISNAYSAAENLGIDLTGTDKNIENLATLMNTIYNDYPKATGSGTFVELAGTKAAKMSITAEGNEQNVIISNKNLANINNTQVGMAWNGSAASSRAILLIPVKAGEKYKLSYQDKSGIDGIYYGQRTNATTIGSGPSGPISAATTITMGSTNTILLLQFNKNNITLADIEAIGIQVECGETATTYVAHQEQSLTLEELNTAKSYAGSTIVTTYNETGSQLELTCSALKA